MHENGKIRNFYVVRDNVPIRRFDFLINDNN